MESFYWTFEYGSVLLGYLYLMFLWPMVVFGKHLKGKSLTYRFGFCVTVQPVLVSTTVLGLGFCHVLNRRLVAVLFYGIFLASFLKKTVRFIMWKIRKPSGEKKYRISRSGFWEYAILGLVILSGLFYFSYGSSRLHGYGSGELYVHHSWIYGLIEGKIFSDGVYPEAMHCFAYCLNALFGIQVYSIMLYLQCVHVVVFLISAYCLLKEVFHWKYTAVLALALYLMLDVSGSNMIYAISRLQWTLPLEFGLHTPFLAALFLVRYLKSGHIVAHFTVWKGKELKCRVDSNLFLFMMSVAASVAIHYFAAVMAFLMCVSFALSALKKIFSRERFVPLCCAVLCGTLVAAAPMAGALASGIPFNYYVLWDVNAMKGESAREELSREQEMQETEQRSGDLSGVYRYGYARLYGKGRARCILILTAAAVCLEAVYRRRDKYSNGANASYAPLILISIIFIVTYAMPYAGLFDLIPASGFCSSGNMLVLAVACIPFDGFLDRTIGTHKGMVQQRALAVSVAGMYLAVLLTGNYRGFLFYAFTRYDSAVMVTNSIIKAFPRKNFLIVSPTDELYHAIEYGWHEELVTFVQNCENEDYTVAPEHVFIYIEKKPFLYMQPYFFNGPFWLGQERKYIEEYIRYSEYREMYPTYGSEFIASGISDEEAQKSMTDLGECYVKLENRVILESKAYEWCWQFMLMHPDDMKVYYEDEDFICYYLTQDANAPYKLGVR